MSELAIIYKNIDEILPYANNPRNNDAGVDKVAASIREFGFKVPIIIDGNGEVVAGHTRLLAARQLGIISIPCVVAADLSPAQIKAFRIADNKVAEYSSWNEELLNLEFEALKNMDFDLQLTGFDLEEFGQIDDKFGETQEDNFDIDAALAEETLCQPGQVWLAGKHRIMCGDATSLADVEKLMGGNVADLVFTDPPYNVDYTGGTKEALKIKNDKMSDDKFYEFLLASFKAMLAATKPGGVIYICHADSEGLNFRKAMIDAGWLMKQCLIWVKNTMVMGRQDYHWKHEPILYGWKPGGAHTWNNDRKQTTVVDNFAGMNIRDEGAAGAVISFSNGLQFADIRVPKYEIIAAGNDEVASVWRIERPLRNSEHPTMKPIDLCARAIKNSSKKWQRVLDLFGGSGSTLIAAEQTGRACCTMELDPKYCSVIVKRWEELTGQRAVLDD